MTKANSAKIVKASLWMTGSFALGKIAQLVSQVILARLLSPKDFGIWAMVLILTNFSVLFRDVAIAQVLVQRGLEDKKIVNTVYSLGIDISIGLFFLQTLIGLPLSQFFGVPVLFPLAAFSAIVFLIGAGAGSHAAVMQRQMKFRELAICDSFANFVRVVVPIACAVGGGGVWSFAFGEVAMAVVDSLLKRWLSKYRFAYSFRLDPIAVAEVKRFITGIIGINLAVQINTNSDNLIIGRLLGTQVLGYYNLGYQLAMMPIYALSQINRVIFSVLSQQNYEGKKVYLCQALEMYAVIFAPIYSLALVIAPWMIPFVYGKAWENAVSLFQIILVFAYARGFMAILGTGLNALNKPGINASINWALVPLSVPAYFLGAELGGARGVAIAVALVMGVGGTVWFWLAICRAAEWNILELIKPILLPTAAIGITTAVVLVIPIPINLQPLLQPLLIFLTYSIALSIFSGGTINRKLIAVVRNSRS